MATYYVDMVNGDNASAGTDWASAWKYLSDNISTRVAGDVIKVAKTPGPSAMPSGSGWMVDKNSTFISLDRTKLAKVESGWTSNQPTYVSIDHTTGQGWYDELECTTKHVYFSVTSSVDGNDMAGYYNLSSSVNLSGYKYVGFWRKCGFVCTSGAIKMHLSDESNCPLSASKLSIFEEYDDVYAQNTNLPVYMEIPSGADVSSISSIGFQFKQDVTTRAYYISSMYAFNDIAELMDMKVLSDMSKTNIYGDWIESTNVNKDNYYITGQGQAMRLDFETAFTTGIMAYQNLAPTGSGLGIDFTDYSWFNIKWGMLSQSTYGNQVYLNLYDTFNASGSAIETYDIATESNNYYMSLAFRIKDTLTDVKSIAIGTTRDPLSYEMHFANIFLSKDISYNSVISRKNDYTDYWAGVNRILGSYIFTNPLNSGAYLEVSSTSRVSGANEMYYMNSEMEADEIYFNGRIGTAGNTIKIRGGYNTVTDTIDGETFIKWKNLQIQYGLNIYNSEYIDVRNISFNGAQSSVNFTGSSNNIFISKLITNCSNGIYETSTCNNNNIQIDQISMTANYGAQIYGRYSTWNLGDLINVSYQSYPVYVSSRYTDIDIDLVKASESNLNGNVTCSSDWNNNIHITTIDDGENYKAGILISSNSQECNVHVENIYARYPAYFYSNSVHKNSCKIDNVYPSTNESAIQIVFAFNSCGNFYLTGPETINGDPVVQETYEFSGSENEIILDTRGHYVPTTSNSTNNDNTNHPAVIKMPYENQVLFLSQDNTLSYVKRNTSHQRSGNECVEIELNNNAAHDERSDIFPIIHNIKAVNGNNYIRYYMRHDGSLTAGRIWHGLLYNGEMVHDWEDITDSITNLWNIFELNHPSCPGDGWYKILFKCYATAGSLYIDDFYKLVT